jgi:hypothetical protein
MGVDVKPSLTRRSLLAAAAALPAAAQQPQQPVVPATPAAETAAIQTQFRFNFEQLRKVQLPMSVEPATLFRA